MGILSDLLNGLLGCLCGQEGHPPQQPSAPPQRPQVVHKPTPYRYPTQQPLYPSAEKPPQPVSEPRLVHKHKEQKEHTPSPPGQVSSPPSRPWSPGRPDANQLNQQNQHYVELRDRANKAGDEMARCFDQAHEAYERRDGKRAKELSNEGKAKKEEMERLHREAAAWIFRENNTDSQPGEIDLHGLYVKEAIQYTDQSIQDARARGDPRIRLIVGKGLHSSNHVAKLKPAIEELIQKHGLVAQLDENNAGVLIVNLDGHTTGGGQVVGAEQLTGGLEQRKDECVIM